MCYRVRPVMRPSQPEPEERWQLSCFELAHFSIQGWWPSQSPLINSCLCTRGVVWGCGTEFSPLKDTSLGVTLPMLPTSLSPNKWQSRSTWATWDPSTTVWASFSPVSLHRILGDANILGKTKTPLYSISFHAIPFHSSQPCLPPPLLYCRVWCTGHQRKNIEALFSVCAILNILCSILFIVCFLQL